MNLNSSCSRLLRSILLPIIVAIPSVFCMLREIVSLQSSSTSGSSADNRDEMSCIHMADHRQYEHSILNYLLPVADATYFFAHASGIIELPQSKVQNSPKAIVTNNSGRSILLPHTSVRRTGRPGTVENSPRTVLILLVSPGYQDTGDSRGTLSRKGRGRIFPASHDCASRPPQTASNLPSRSQKRRRRDEDPHTPKLPPEPPTDDTGAHRLACPFYLHDRRMYPQCGKRRFRNFADVKQHLTRAHEQKLHCARCGIPFEGDNRSQDWILHQRSQSCPEISFTPFPGITQDQVTAIAHISARRSQHDKWYELWHILFADSIEEPPASPWLPLLNNDSEVHLQFMMDLRNELINDDQRHESQPQWGTQLMVSATNDQRQAIVAAVMDWFIEQGRARISNEPDTGPRPNRPESSLLYPTPNPELQQSAHDGSLSNSGFSATAASPPMIFAPRPSLMQPPRYEQHGVVDNDLHDLMQASLRLPHSQQPFSEPTAASSSVHMQDFPPQEQHIHLSQHLDDIIGGSFPGDQEPEHTRIYGPDGSPIVDANLSCIGEGQQYNEVELEENWPNFEDDD